MTSPNWERTALFITYDEHGGYYDHVPPPAAVLPDDTPPILGPNDLPGAYNRYGFRVPLLVISPWAKLGYVSSVVQDHTEHPALRRAQVDPRRDDRPRRQRRGYDRLLRLPPCGVPRAAEDRLRARPRARAEAVSRRRAQPAAARNPNGNASLSAAQSALRARAKAAGLHVQRLAPWTCELNGKVAVVTGASKGIGSPSRRNWPAEGAVVTGGARTTEGVQGIEGVTPFAVDLGEPDGPAALVDDAVERHGQLDILVNNVGFVDPRLDGFLSVGDEDFEASMRLELLRRRCVRLARPSPR